ncbi:hypothetical protein DENIS_3974 [Desulfonema ishimotonii]|uniref:Uncharacterized protein n=1 Tax=Desulfonema ishimotonii TaxID=45657 RepID=A0A401G1A7_9BACT|nr:hypothetical protein DENIS_3974 [Desulfonema ishimotonii]
MIVVFKRQRLSCTLKVIKVPFLLGNPDALLYDFSKSGDHNFSNQMPSSGYDDGTRFLQREPERNIQIFKGMIWVWHRERL